MTSKLVSQCLSVNLQWPQSLQVRPNCRTCWKLSVANKVWTGEDQNLGSQWNFVNTHCHDTLRMLPREWLIRGLLKQLTRQTKKHVSIDPALNFLDGNHHCYDLTLPRKLCERRLHPMCEENPPLFALFIRTPHCSSRVISPNWCNETESEGTFFWEWWTKHSKKWMHTGYVSNTGQNEILTKTSSRDHAVSTLTRTADKLNCTQSWCTSS